MRQSAYVEETQVVAQAEPDIPRFERVAIWMGLTALVLVLAIGLALYLAKFQVDARLVRAAIWVLVIGSIVTFFRMRPASKLTPTERMIRSKRNAFVLLGLLTGVAVLGSIVTATSLHTKEDWLMFVFSASSPIGFFFIINTRFGMGSS